MGFFILSLPDGYWKHIHIIYFILIERQQQQRHHYYYFVPVPSTSASFKLYFIFSPHNSLERRSLYKELCEIVRKKGKKQSEIRTRVSSALRLPSN